MTWEMKGGREGVKRLKMGMKTRARAGMKMRVSRVVERKKEGYKRRVRGSYVLVRTIKGVERKEKSV